MIYIVNKMVFDLLTGIIAIFGLALGYYTIKEVVEAIKEEL